MRVSHREGRRRRSARETKPACVNALFDDGRVADLERPLAFDIAGGRQPGRITVGADADRDKRGVDRLRRPEEPVRGVAFVERAADNCPDDPRLDRRSRTGREDRQRKDSG